MAQRTLTKVIIIAVLVIDQGFEKVPKKEAKSGQEMHSCMQSVS